jgi:hypothetical protein
MYVSTVLRITSLINVIYSRSSCDRCVCTWPDVDVARPTERRKFLGFEAVCSAYALHMILTAAPTKVLALIDAVQLDLFRYMY